MGGCEGGVKVLREWTDEEGYPQREVVVGSVECPVCLQEVELTAEADAWEEDDHGGWKITGYGPGAAEHCGLLLAETDGDGTVSAFPLEPGADPDSALCGDHRCRHEARDHADLRTPSGRQQLARGACNFPDCPCPEFAEEAPCKGRAAIVVATPSGQRYERCACGAVRVASR